MHQKKEKAHVPQIDETIKEPVGNRGKSRSPRKSDSPEKSRPVPANPHQHFFVQRYSETITMGWQMPMIKKVTRPMTRPVKVMCMMRMVCLTKVAIILYLPAGGRKKKGPAICRPFPNQSG